MIGSQVHHCAAVHGLTFFEAQAHGGGVYASTVRLSYSRVFANTAGEYGFGGGVAGGLVVLHQSQVYGNDVEGAGGGVHAVRAEIVRSTVHDNEAYEGGGIHASEVAVRNSTVSGNRAVSRQFLGGHWPTGGGIYARGANGQSRIVDSTISGNSALHYNGAAYFAGDAAIYNSTITANVETLDDGSGVCQGEGAISDEGQLRLESTIIAGNACTMGPHYDIGAGTIVGSHNLIGTSSVPLPADTISADPRLGPLANNGGHTPTHALLGASPAINRGRNPLRLGYDQRGAGFPRVKGPRADIGAYER